MPDTHTHDRSTSAPSRRKSPQPSQTAPFARRDPIWDAPPFELSPGEIRALVLETIG